MDVSPPKPSFPSLAAWPSFGQWAALIGLSAVLTVGLELLHLPAALLMGPMVAAIVLAACEARVRVTRAPFVCAQGVVGCLIAHSFTFSVIGLVMRDWPVFLLAIVSAVVASAVLGWALARWRVLPGTTAVWGSSPGAASAMVLMSEAYGADFRLVAFMQYLRVVLVVAAASLVARLWSDPSAAAAAEIVWFPPMAWGPFAATMALAVFGAAAGIKFRIPAGSLLVPVALGAALQASGALDITLPPVVLAASYTILGWSIGLRFTRAILAHAARALPRLVCSILVLMGICGGVAYLLTRLTGIDPLTAYLATSPGGADSIAIIAASTNVDVSFVMALQTARLLVVILTGPALARFIARHAGVHDDDLTTR